MSAENIRAFGVENILANLEKAGDAFGVGDDLYAQAEYAIDVLVENGEKWAKKCQEDWSKVKASVPWATGNLSRSIQYEDGIKESGEPYFWVGVDLNRLLGPKTAVIENKIDYPKQYGQEVEVSAEDYTEEVNAYNRTGPDKFIQNVWWAYAEKNLKETMK